MRRSLMEWAGWILGWLISPLIALIAMSRRSRMFHPEGLVFDAEVTPSTPDPYLDTLAARLRGQALVRISNSWWKRGKELPDDLGIAIRFRGPPGEQDLLFATIRHWWTTLLAPITTNHHDFLKNYYYSVSPFDVRGVGRVKFRLSPNPSLQNVYVKANRKERLLREVKRGHVFFRLELQKQGGREQEWTPLATVSIRELTSRSQDNLRFNPFRTGRGIYPRGFLNHMRPGVYWASQQARKRSERPARKHAA